MMSRPLTQLPWLLLALAWSPSPGIAAEGKGAGDSKGDEKGDDDDSTEGGDEKEGDDDATAEEPKRSGEGEIKREDGEDTEGWSQEGEVQKKEEKKEEVKKKEGAAEPTRVGNSGNWYEVSVDCGNCPSLLDQQFGIDDPNVMRQFYDFVQLAQDKKTGKFFLPSAGKSRTLFQVDKGSRILIYQYAEDTGARLTDTYATVWDMDVKAKGGLLYGRKYELQAWTAEAYDDNGKTYKAKQSFLPTGKLLTYPDLAPVKALTTDKANFSVAENARIAFVGYSAFVRSDVNKDAIEEDRTAQRAAAEANAKRLRDQKAWYGKGEKFVEDRNWTDAQAAFMEARKIGLDSTDLCYNLGLAYQMNKDYPAAIAEYQKVLGINPRDTDVRYNLARIYEKQKAWDNAIKEYQAILKFDPDDASARERLELLKAARDMVQ